MDTIINILDFIGILTIIYSIAVYMHIDTIHKAGGSIKDYMPWFIQLMDDNIFYFAGDHKYYYFYIWLMVNDI